MRESHSWGRCCDSPVNRAAHAESDALVGIDPIDVPLARGAVTSPRSTGPAGNSPFPAARPSTFLAATGLIGLPSTTTWRCDLQHQTLIVKQAMARGYMEKKVHAPHTLVPERSQRLTVHVSSLLIVRELLLE